jgi:predicted metal-binding protein
MLSLWTKRAQTLGGKNYWQYQHQVEVQSVAANAQNPNSATVEAKVKEKASYYEQGKLNPQRSFDDHLRIRYDLVRTADGWLLKNSQVLE